MTAVPEVGLVAAILRAGEVALLLELRGPGGGRTAVVAGESDERVVRDARLIERAEDFADGPVGFHHEVAVIAEAAFALPLAARDDGRVRRVEREVEKERPAGFGAGGDVFARAPDQRGQHVHGFEDLRDAVIFKNRLHHPRVMKAEERVEAARDRAVARDRAQRCARELALPLAAAAFVRALDGVAEMPFAETRRVIAVLLQQRRHGQPLGCDQRRHVAIEHAVLQSRAPRVAPREQSVARRRADRRAAVGVRKGQPLRRQLVEVRRLDFAALRIEALHVAVAEVVGENVNEVGFARGVGGGEQGRGGEQQGGAEEERICREHGHLCDSAEVAAIWKKVERENADRHG